MDPNFFHLGSRFKKIPDSKKLFLFLSSRKPDPSVMFITDPDLDFVPIPDPGVKKAPDPGSATLDRGASLKKKYLFNNEKKGGLKSGSIR